MTSFMPENIKEAASKLTSNWLKGSDFEGGLTLKVAKPMEIITSQYGAEEDDYLVENNILETGQSFRYTFEDASGVERKIDSSSTPFFIGMKQCEELGVGDWVLITRTGKTDKTRYTVEKVDEPEVSTTKPEVASGQPNDEYDPTTAKEIPF